MTGRYSEDTRIVPQRRKPCTEIAHERAQRFPDPLDRARFMDAFATARIATVSGDDGTYLAFREAWGNDDSVRVAGLIEGAASVRKG